ncbi:hypothetical protein LTR20_001244 [Exophiala xenobiotica]|nr:hypothetical protein LTR20_001244 [Exophiala xenobiotica]KAK5492099.1 hypothetical protein LTR55_003451 [Exophiala xenobiotica]
MPAIPEWSMESHLEMMKAVNITKSILSISSPGTVLVPGNNELTRKVTKYCNDYGADMKKQKPEQFGFFASLPLTDVEWCLKEIPRALDELDADGFVVMTNFGGSYLGDKAFDPIFDELNRRKAKVFMHPTTPCLKTGTAATPLPDFPRPMFEFLFDTARAVINLFLSGTVTRCPNVSFLVPHVGGTFPPLINRFSGFAAAVKIPGVDSAVNPDWVKERLNKQFYFDSAGWAFSEQMKGMLEYVTVDRMLYGSDFPFTSLSHVQFLSDQHEKYLPEVFPNEEDQQKLCSQNALRLFNGGDARFTQSVTLSHQPLHRQSPTTALSTYNDLDTADDKIYTAPPPPHFPLSEASSSSPPSPTPPPFSSLYFPSDAELDRIRATVTETACDSLLASAPAPSFEEALAEDEVECKAEAETKAALPPDTKPQSSRAVEEGEPPPPYTEGSSPLDSFSYIMAAAGGAASIITQVQQSPGPPINTLGAGEAAADEHITLDLRGSRFTLSREELLTLPEFVLLSLFPNGLLPDGHMNSFHDGDVYPVDVRLSSNPHPITILSNPYTYIGDMTYHSQYDPASLQYMLNFFRDVAQSIPSTSPSPTTPPENDPISIEPLQGSTKDMLQDRAGIIVLREDLDFYVIPPRADIEAVEMTEVKRAAGRSLLKQNGIFSGLKRSEEAGTTEQHLIEMLTAG